MISLQNLNLFFVTGLFCTFSLLLMCCHTGNTSDDKVKMELQGKIKSVKEISYEAIDQSGEITKGQRSSPNWWKDSYTVFDKDGNATEEILYRADGRIWTKSIFHYDAQNRRIETEVLGANLKPWYKKLTKYNDSDKPIEDILYKAGDTLGSKWLYKYDNKGNKILEERFHPDGKLSIKSTFKYNDKGYKIEETMFNSEGGQIFKWVSHYDDRGLKVEEYYYNSKNTLDAKEIYQYKLDNHNNWIKKVIFYGDQPKFIILRDIEYFQ
ncbi:MAG: hypothetical protein J5I59_01425 [Saprospiraceae bacterium]|nr:hypothetical protein [Saprospiraceae bacterium]